MVDSERHGIALSMPARRSKHSTAALQGAHVPLKTDLSCISGPGVLVHNRVFYALQPSIVGLFSALGTTSSAWYWLSKFVRRITNFHLPKANSLKLRSSMRDVI